MRALAPNPVFCQAPAAAPPAKGEGDDMREGPLRYMAYAARMKLLILKAEIKIAVIQGARYVAYSSDVGESLRPVVKPWMVNATYGIAGAYIIGDVAFAGYKTHSAGHSSEVVAATVAYTATFQSIASLALPAVIIHTVVHQAQHALDKPTFASMPRLVRFGPSAIGLALIPGMPLIDPPCERAIEFVFDKVWPAWREGHVPHEHGH